MHFIDTSDIHGLCMIPALSRSKCYIKVTDTLAIPDGIIFDFLSRTATYVHLPNRKYELVV